MQTLKDSREASDMVTAPALSRRQFLRNTAAGSAVAIVGAAPAVAEAGTAQGENPDLLRLHAAIVEAQRSFHDALARRVEAREAYMQIAPEPPPDIVRKDFGPSVDYEDGPEMPVEPSDPASRRGRFVLTTRRMAGTHRRVDGVLHPTEWLPIYFYAEEYEAAKQVARDASGFTAADNKVGHEAAKVMAAVQALVDQAARTERGLWMKAHAFIAYQEAAAASGPFSSPGWLAEAIAKDALAVLDGEKLG